MIDLYNGDCLEIMDKLIKEGIVVDAIITDPPYGTTACKWDSVIPFDEMWLRLNKLIKPNGAIVLFGSEPFSSLLRVSNLKDYRYDWKWRKTKPTNMLNASRQPMRDSEDIMIFYKKQCLYNPQKIKNPKGIEKRGLSPYNNSNSGHHTRGVSKVKTSKHYEADKLHPRTIITFSKDNPVVHPTQKPVALMEYLIKTYTNENELVLDFTMGSGTTGVACKNTNRRFVGIEKDEKYFTIAKERILMDRMADLFDIPVVKEKQL